MTATIWGTILYSTVLIGLARRIRAQETKKIRFFLGWAAVCMAAGLILRLVLACTTKGFMVDRNTFYAWGQLTYDVGFGRVYNEATFLDYPPGYLYVLWFLEGVRRAFSLAMDGPVYGLLSKLPAILADLAGAAMLLCFARRKTGEPVALLLCAAYLFCPVILLNGAVWGQIDAVSTMLLVGAVLLLAKQRALLSGILYAAAFLCKPQMLLFAPIFFIWPILQKQWKQLAMGLLGAFASMTVIALPFAAGKDLLWLPRLYLTTFTSYGRYSVNAYNFWSLIGKNWHELPEGFGGKLLTGFTVAVALACCAVVLWRSKGATALFGSCGALMTALYLVGTDMHERYAFPVMLCLLFLCALTQSRGLLCAFAVLSMANAWNVAHVLYLFNEQGGQYDPNAWVVKGMSAVQVAALCYVLLEFARILWPGLLQRKARAVMADGSADMPNRSGSAGKRELSLLVLPEQAGKMLRVDVIAVCVISVVYAGFAFWELGDRKMALTAWTPAQGESVVVSAQTPVTTLMYLPGLTPDASGAYPRLGVNVSVETSADGQHWTSWGSLTDGSVFAWRKFSLAEPATLLRITAQDGNVVLNEIGLLTAEGAVVPVEGIEGNTAVLLDEQNMVPSVATYKNGSYFDEIYHARTAYEHMLRLEPFEYTHPPLGKMLISLGIRMFGMNPFGWRFVGTLCGVLMLQLLYHLLKQLLGRTLLCVCGTLLFAFDFMHFTQTRIATIDTYAVLFLLLMYDAMAVFLRRDIAKEPMRRLLTPLLISGVCMGLGAASKWTVAYGAVGLAVLFFGKLWFAWRVCTKDTEKQAVLQRCVTLCLWCCLFFVMIPFGIYYGAYLPITTLPHQPQSAWDTFWRYQTNMFQYHAQLKEPHAFASPWYSWPVVARPVWYFAGVGNGEAGQYSTIAALGNPAVWWLAIGAMGYAAVRAWRKNCLAAIVAVIGFLSVYVPWMFVSRVAFLYHYFTALPFLIVALMLAAKCLLDTAPLRRCVPLGARIHVTIGTLCLCGYMAVNFALFAVFYPVLSGASTTLTYVEKLRLFSTWYF